MANLKVLLLLNTRILQALLRLYKLLMDMSFLEGPSASNIQLQKNVEMVRHRGRLVDRLELQTLFSAVTLAFKLKNRQSGTFLAKLGRLQVYVLQWVKMVEHVDSATFNLRTQLMLPKQ